MKKQSKNKLYEKDFYAWANVQAEHLKNRELNLIDYENLIEEIESLGRSEKRALQHHLEILLMHMLKAKYQKEKHTKSWDLSIKNSSLKANQILDENPSLKPLLKGILFSSYESSRIKAAMETNLDEETFPEACPWKLKDIFPELEKKYL